MKVSVSFQFWGIWFSAYHRERITGICIGLCSEKEQSVFVCFEVWNYC